MLKKNICNGRLCIIIQSISQSLLNPTEYRWNTCLYEKQHKCMRFAKPNITYCSMLSARVFKQLWRTCLFNIMKWGGTMGVEGKKQQYFASRLNCNCCSRKELGTGKPQGYLYIWCASTHISTCKQTFFFFSFNPSCLAPIPMTCNSDCKHSGLHHSAQLYGSCIWDITTLVLMSWKHSTQTCLYLQIILFIIIFFYIGKNMLQNLKLFS